MSNYGNIGCQKCCQNESAPDRSDPGRRLVERLDVVFDDGGVGLDLRKRRGDDELLKVFHFLPPLYFPIDDRAVEFHACNFDSAIAV